MEKGPGSVVLTVCLDVKETVSRVTAGLELCDGQRVYASLTADPLPETQESVRAHRASLRGGRGDVALLQRFRFAIAGYMLPASAAWVPNLTVCTSDKMVYFSGEDLRVQEQGEETSTPPPLSTENVLRLAGSEEAEACDVERV